MKRNKRLRLSHETIRSLSGDHLARVGGGEKPQTTSGLDFYNTGVALVTDKPAEGVKSITSDEALKICWGN